MQNGVPMDRCQENTARYELTLTVDMCDKGITKTVNVWRKLAAVHLRWV